MVRLRIDSVEHEEEKVDIEVGAVIVFCTTVDSEAKGTKSEVMVHAELQVNEMIIMIQRMSSMSQTLYENMKKQLSPEDMLKVDQTLGFASTIEEVPNE